MGHTVAADEYDWIDFELDSCVRYVCNYCNIAEVPPIIEPKLIDRVCSGYLSFKKNSGSLEGFDYNAAVKTIKEGDTAIDYAIGSGEATPESRFDALLAALEREFDKWITPYRRLRW